MKKSELRNIIREELLKEGKGINISRVAIDIEGKYEDQMKKAVVKKLSSLIKGKKIEVEGTEEYGGSKWKNYTGVITDISYSQYYDSYEIELQLDNKTDINIGMNDVKILG